jgi:hypothetical protein
MLNQITHHIKELLTNFSEQDSILFNNKTYPINKENFETIIPNTNKTIAFIDGGQAEILKAGNFCLSFIRVYAVVFESNKKVKDYKNEFYLFTKAVYKDDIFYESKIFPLTEKIINENDLLISSNDSSIKTGLERAPITKVTNMARRFAELSLAKEIQADFIILDGTLEPSFRNEEKYLTNNLSALAKSSQLFTTSGNSPVILLNKVGPVNCWLYNLNETTKFIKLNPKAKHVFRFEGNPEVLPYLIENSQDALFLGYPYGLILVDKLARVSNSEKTSLNLKFMLNDEISEYLTTTNAHDILDNLG